MTYPMKLISIYIFLYYFKLNYRHFYGRTFLRKKEVYFVFISCNFEFFLMNAQAYVYIDQGIYKEKLKVAQNEKRQWDTLTDRALEQNRYLLHLCLDRDLSLMK